MKHFARYMSLASVLACVPPADADGTLPKLGTVTVEGHQKNTLESPASGAEQGPPSPPALSNGSGFRSLCRFERDDKEAEHHKFLQ